uniref:Family with sequence similarity 168 member B n=1 Tax=Erpetoichthys calabaricus TaxID=27687 RepID=A0A8C4T0D8_ERPCA
MNPVYSPAPSGVPYANPKGIGYPAGFPLSYAAAAPAYTPNIYPGANTAFQAGYTPGTSYKVPCSPSTGTVPPYSSSPNPYQTAVYPVRSAYPQQNPYAQVGQKINIKFLYVHLTIICVLLTVPTYNLVWFILPCVRLATGSSQR